jgi:hypothetical protein
VGEVLLLLRVAQSISKLLWEPTQINHKQEVREKGEEESNRKAKINTMNMTICFPEVPLRRTYVSVEEFTKDRSLSTLSLSQTVIESS